MFVHRSPTRFPARQLRGVAELSDLRADFVAWLRDVGVDGDTVDDLSVVLSELGANAIRETPAGADPALVEASIDGRRLELTVSNEVGPDAASQMSDWDLQDPLRTGGRGLLLVSAFVDEVDVEVAERRLVVRCVTAL